MGYGEVGGDGSVQVNVWLRDPEVPEVELGNGRSPFDRANGRGQISRKLDGMLNGIGTVGSAYVGKDNQGNPGGKVDVPLGDFAVTVEFQNPAERDAARLAFNNATGLTVTFRLAVRRNQPGQIQIEWP
jgi:hypothetical protein